VSEVGPTVIEAPDTLSRMTGYGTKLPIRDVRFHGEYWRWSGLAADIAKMARLTHFGSRAP
jgi:hypothetical protein